MVSAARMKTADWFADLRARTRDGHSEYDWQRLIEALEDPAELKDAAVEALEMLDVFVRARPKQRSAPALSAAIRFLAFPEARTEASRWITAAAADWNRPSATAEHVDELREILFVSLRANGAADAAFRELRDLMISFRAIQHLSIEPEANSAATRLVCDLAREMMEIDPDPNVAHHVLAIFWPAFETTSALDAGGRRTREALRSLARAVEPKLSGLTSPPELIREVASSA
jgi:hypothetical protein